MVEAFDSTFSDHVAVLQFADLVGDGDRIPGGVKESERESPDVGLSAGADAAFGASALKTLGTVMMLYCNSLKPACAGRVSKRVIRSLFSGSWACQRSAGCMLEHKSRLY